MNWLILTYLALKTRYCNLKVVVVVVVVVVMVVVGRETVVRLRH